MIKLFEQYNFQKEIDEIDYSKFDISNIKNKDMFDYIYSYAPITLKDYIDFMKTIDQRSDYHPEGNVYNHTKAVVNRIAKTKDIDLIISAFLHDTGKDRTQKIENDIIMQPGHEVYSVELLKVGSPWRDWVKKLGADPDIIKFIIRNHMRMKDMSNNNKNKKWFDKLEFKYKKYLEIFNEVDHGGHFNESYEVGHGYMKKLSNSYPSKEIGYLIGDYINKNIPTWEKEGWVITLNDTMYWSHQYNIYGEEYWDFYTTETLDGGPMEDLDLFKLTKHINDTTRLEVELDGLIVGMDGISLLNIKTEQMKEFHFQNKILSKDPNKLEFIIKIGANQKTKEKFTNLFAAKKFGL